MSDSFPMGYHRMTQEEHEASEESAESLSNLVGGISCGDCEHLRKEKFACRRFNTILTGPKRDLKRIPECDQPLLKDKDD